MQIDDFGGQVRTVGSDPRESIHVCKPSEEQELKSYLLKKSHGKNLSLSYNESKLQNKMQHFGLSPSNFLVARDHQQKIIGCTAMWSSQGIQDAIPLRYGLSGHNFRQFLKFGKIA